MRIAGRSTLSLFLALAVLTSVGCNRVDVRINRNFTGHKLIVLHNRVRVQVDTEGEGSYAYEGVNIRSYDSWHQPYYDWRVTTSAGKFHITDRGAGNGAVLVNGQAYHVALGQHVHIDNKGQIRTAEGMGRSDEWPEALRAK